MAAGNHDANLANKNRMDSLVPIPNMIHNTKYSFYYLKNSGIYAYHNLVLIVYLMNIGYLFWLKVNLKK